MKPEDIDCERKLIHIKGAKGGGKDRYTILSDSAMGTLNAYLKEYTPQKGLFSGAKPGKHIKSVNDKALSQKNEYENLSLASICLSCQIIKKLLYSKT